MKINRNYLVGTAAVAVLALGATGVVVGFDSSDAPRPSAAQPAVPSSPDSSKRGSADESPERPSEPSKAPVASPTPEQIRQSAQTAVRQAQASVSLPFTPKPGKVTRPDGSSLPTVPTTEPSPSTSTTTGGTTGGSTGGTSGGNSGGTEGGTNGGTGGGPSTPTDPPNGGSAGPDPESSQPPVLN